MQRHLLHRCITRLNICTNVLQAFDHPSIDSIATFLAESDLLPASLIKPAAPSQPPAAAAAPAASYPTAPAVPITARLPAPPQPPAPASILIVASAFKAPGSASPCSFLLPQQAATAGGPAGADGSSVVPLARWDVDLALPSHMPGELQARFGCFLEGVEAFDPEAVGMTPAEVLLVDPQQRLVMEAFGDVAAATTAAGVYSR